MTFAILWTHRDPVTASLGLLLETVVADGTPFTGRRKRILSTAAVVAVVRGAAVLADFDLAAHPHLSLLGGDIPPTP